MLCSVMYFTSHICASSLFHLPIFLSGRSLLRFSSRVKVSASRTFPLHFSRVLLYPLFFFVSFSCPLDGGLFMINKGRQLPFSCRAEKFHLTLSFLAPAELFFWLVSRVFWDAPLSRFMGALQWGRVIVLLSRGLPGEVNVYFCALKRGGPCWLSKTCGRVVWNKRVSSSSIQHPFKPSCPSPNTAPLLRLSAACCHILCCSF